MSQSTPEEPQGPGSGAAKPVTEPPGGAVDRVLNDEPANPDEDDEEREGEASGEQTED
jgi:hypothetical protein